MTSDALLEIRDARLDDLPAIQSIYAHAVLTMSVSFETQVPSLEELATRMDKTWAAQAPYLVACVGTKVLGYAYAAPYGTRQAYRFTLETSIYVAPEAQGQRVGRALLQALVTRCRQGPWRSLVAVIGDSQNTASRALHKSQGYVEIGILRNVGFKFDRWLDTVLMQLDLRG